MPLFRRALLLLTATALLLVPVMTAQAANKQTGLQITPLRSRPVQKPGDTSSGQITVSNHSGKPLTVDLSVERFRVTDEDYHYDFSPGDNTDWVRLTEHKLQLEDNESKNIAYSLAVPLNASPGGYYFAIFASTQTATTATSFNEVERVASLIYLEVSGLIERKVSLLGIDTPWFQISPNLDVSARLSNQGNSHYEARLAENIEPIVGHRPPSTQVVGLVLPSSVRKLTGHLHMPKLPGVYRLTVEFSPPQGGHQMYSHLILYLPIWSWVLGTAAVILVIYLTKRSFTKKHRKSA